LTSTDHLIIQETLKNVQDRDRELQEIENQQQDPRDMEPQVPEQEKGQREPRFIRYVPAVYASLMAVGAIPVLQGALSLPGPTFALFVLMFMIFHFVSLKQLINELRERESRSKDKWIKSQTQHVECLEQLVQALQQVNQLLEPLRQENREYHKESMERLRQEKARLEELCARRVREMEDVLMWMSDDEVDDLLA